MDSRNVRIVGQWTGYVQLPPLATATLKMLVAKVSESSGFPVDQIKLICAGRTLREEEPPGGGSSSSRLSLQELGVGPQSKIFLVRTGADQSKQVNEGLQRAERLSRLTAAADAMARRDGNSSDDSPHFQLENQNGQPLLFESDEVRRALLMGMMMHARGRGFLKACAFADALQVLALAEEAFSLCQGNEFLEASDNVAMLQLDIVWCHFLLRDEKSLASSRQRLQWARAGLRRAYGANLERLQMLQSQPLARRALYVRLELLEGVAAFHSGQLAEAQAALLRARSLYQQLCVSDADIAQLAAMGFQTREARAALRISGGNISSSVAFLTEEAAKQVAREAEDRKRRAERREQKAYGRTPAGKLVDMDKLAYLASLGYERHIVAEALRQSGNQSEAALDSLLSPDRQLALQMAIVERLAPTAATSPLDTQDATTSGSAQLPPGAATAISGAAGRPGEASSTATPGDAEMEADIAREVDGDSWLAGCDADVAKEGEAIREYLALLAAAGNPSEDAPMLLKL